MVKDYRHYNIKPTYVDCSTFWAGLFVCVGFMAIFLYMFHGHIDWQNFLSVLKGL
jgi:hypothetical protein